MHIVSNESFKVQDYQLEVLDIKEDVIKDFNFIEKGYLFHFFLGDHSITHWEDNDFKFNLEYDVKIVIPGNLHSLDARLENFKRKIIDNKENLVKDLDQFGYLFMFIVKQNNIYQLVISSDSIGFDTLSFLYCQSL